MSISNTSYIAFGDTDGVTSTFSFPFRIFLSTDIVVSLIQISNPSNVINQILGTNYTVALAANGAEGGSITFTTPPATGYQWYIQRVEPFTQSLSIPTEGAIPAQSLNNSLDLLTMLVIQINGQGVQIPPLFTGTIPCALPNPVANLALAWDPTGTFLTNITPSAAGSLSVPIANSNLQAITIANKVNGSSLYSLGSILAGAGVIPNANLPIGTAPGDVPVLDSNSKIAYANLESFPYVKVSETQASGTNGQSTVSTGSWLTAILNTKDSDTASIASLGSNEVTLPAGTYKVFARVPFNSTGLSQARLYNATGSAVLLIGSGACAVRVSGSGNSQDDSVIQGVITLAGSTIVALQYQITTTASGNAAIGGACSFGTEVYSVAEFTKIG